MHRWSRARSQSPADSAHESAGPIPAAPACSRARARGFFQPHSDVPDAPAFHASRAMTAPYPPCLLAIRNPNTMCSPPNAAPKNQFPHAAGPSTASPPTNMKHNPITGTIDTEYAPPVMIPAPYNKSHAAGKADSSPARNNTNVRNAPATNGGAKPSATFRAGPENSGNPRRFAFQVQASNPITTATMPSASQTRNQEKAETCRAANTAAPNAVTPERTCPHPETAVNAEARSIVSRMKRKSSATFGSASGRANVDR